jgi:hypothetical protein
VIERKAKKRSGFYAFLEREGLQITEEVALCAARKMFYAECKRKSKQEIRKRCKSFEILLDTRELRKVQEKAGQLNMSLTAYIKRSAIAAEAFNPVIIGKIRELLIMDYGFFELKLNERSCSEAVRDQLLLRLVNTEQKVVALLLR